MSVNVVPDRCEVEIDRRMIPDESPEGCREQVQRAVQSHLTHLDGIEFLPPWVIMPTMVPQGAMSDHWIKGLSEAIERVGGSRPEVLGVPYGTDAGPLGESGLPCFVFGPGDITQAHTKDEWVELDQIRLASEMYFEIARELGSR